MNRILKPCAVLFLSAVLAAGVFAAEALDAPATDSAAQAVLASTLSPDGEGTAESPYLIKDAASLAFLAERVNTADEAYTNAHYRQTAPITVSEDTAYTPIGTEESPFSGVFDGDGYPIFFSQNLSVEGENLIIGLFGVAKNASFENVVLVGEITATASGKNDKVYAGFLCAQYTLDKNESCFIRGCEAIGSISANATYPTVGTLIAKQNAAKGELTVSDCYSEYDLTIGDNKICYIGGLIGMSATMDESNYQGAGSVVIRHCGAVGNIQMTGKSALELYCGGLVGHFIQNQLGWFGARSTLFDEDIYSFSSCFTAGTHSVAAKGGFHYGTMAGYFLSVYENKNIYSSLESKDCIWQEKCNADIKAAESLLDKAFLTDTLDFDPTLWTVLEDKSGCRLTSRYSELVPLSCEKADTLTFQPINCPNGTWAFVFMTDGERRMKGVRLKEQTDKTVTMDVRVHQSSSGGYAMLFDSKTIAPLLDRTLPFEATNT